jgi:hypothetical protein
MTRKLVVCCDGTWNKPRDETNVYRTYKFLQGRLKSQREVPGSKDGWCYCEGKASDGSEVVLYYDKGGGTGFGELVRVAPSVKGSRITSAMPTTFSPIIIARAMPSTSSASAVVPIRRVPSAASSTAWAGCWRTPARTT